MMKPVRICSSKRDVNFLLHFFPLSTTVKFMIIEVSTSFISWQGRRGLFSILCYQQGLILAFYLHDGLSLRTIKMLQGSNEYKIINKTSRIGQTKWLHCFIVSLLLTSTFMWGLMKTGLCFYLIS